MVSGAMRAATSTVSSLPLTRSVRTCGAAAEIAAVDAEPVHVVDRRVEVARQDHRSRRRCRREPVGTEQRRQLPFLLRRDEAEMGVEDLKTVSVARDLHPQGAPRLETGPTGEPRQAPDELFQRDRVVADAHAGRVVDRISNCRCRTDDPDLSHAA